MPARIAAAVATLAGGLRAELFEALVVELRGEIARLAPVPPTRPTTTDAGTGTGPTWVQNTRTRVFHLSRVGPVEGGAPRLWAARCGWTYGHYGGYVLAAPGGDQDERCDRCLGKPGTAQRELVRSLTE